MDVSRTKPSTLRLSEVARHVVIPDGIVTTGWTSVEAQCREFGDEFDEWQRGLGKVILGKRADGIYASTIGGITLSIPRQVAKTFLVGRIIFALCVLFPGMTVLWTAQRTRTSTRTFQSLQGFAKRSKVAPYIDHTRTANGEQEIGFRNGSVIMFGAREGGFGRGFDEVDVEVFDEAQILTEKALEDMVAATNQSRHPHGALLFFMGTPPRPVDPGEVFAHRRAQALSGESEDAVYVECSADPDADADDREQWIKANPSYPLRTPLRSMLRLRKNLPSEESWMREALGIWDSVAIRSVIPMDAWNNAHDEHSVAKGQFALGVEVGPDAKWASVAMAGQRDDGTWHIELQAQKQNADWVVPYVAEFMAGNPQIRALVVDAGSPSSTLFEKFTAAKLTVTAPKVTELGTACTNLLDGIKTRQVRHTGQIQLNVAASIAGKRALADTGMWVWSRKTTSSDITPIQACTLALWGTQSSTVKKPSRSGKPRRAVVL